jgi:hypothetical protein
LPIEWKNNVVAASKLLRSFLFQVSLFGPQMMAPTVVASLWTGSFGFDLSGSPAASVDYVQALRGK